MTDGFTPAEMMIVASARQLAGERVCFVGVGPPNIACNLAKRTVAPGMLGLLTLHPMAADVIVMAVLSLAFIVPAVWQFSRSE